MDYSIRKLGSNDLPLLTKLLSRINEFNESDRSLAKLLLTIILEQPYQKEYKSIVAVNPMDVPLGYACYGPTPLTDGTFDLFWIAVDPAWAGHGVGSGLLKEVEIYVRQMNGRMLIIETSSSNLYVKTRRFYEKNGYSLAETLQDFYREGEDRLTYLKKFT